MKKHAQNCASPVEPHQGDLQVTSLLYNRLGVIPTESYLRDNEIVSVVSNVVQPNAVAAVVDVERRMSAPPPSPSTGNLRIALTNIALNGFAGSELWTLEMAAFYHRRGIPTLVYSPVLGQVAEKFSVHGFTITDDPRLLSDFGPTILHLHHHVETAAAIQAAGPNCKIVNMVHGLLPQPEWPYPKADAYVAVSLHARAKVTLVGPPAWSDIIQLPNFFDPHRFTTKGRKRPRRVLIHSSRITADYLDNMRAMLGRQGLKVDQIGYGGTVATSPEALLPQYKIVFAAGRSAIEALASGCHVILWDHGIVGPAITPANFWYAVAANFSVAAGIFPFRMPDDPTMEAWLAEQIALIDKKKLVRSLIHQYLTVDAVGAHMLNVYSNAVK